MFGLVWSVLAGHDDTVMFDLGQCWLWTLPPPPPTHPPPPPLSRAGYSDTVIFGLGQCWLESPPPPPRLWVEGGGGGEGERKQNKITVSLRTLVFFHCQSVTEMYIFTFSRLP